MRVFLPFTLLLALGLSGCPDDEEGTTSAEAGGDTTSGGENTGIDPAAGGGSETDPGWDGDPDDPGGGGETGSGTEGGSETEPEEPGSAWGSPVAETGRPLPPRRPMNASARQSYQSGINAAQAGSVSQARQSFEAALSADSNAYKAAYNLGVLADRAGNERQALEFYQRALRIQADYERAAEGIVAIYVRRGDVPQAISFIEPLARQWERNLYLQALHAETLVHANRLDDAVLAARRALRRDERFVPAMVAIVKASLRRGRNELAETVIDQALRIDDNDAELHYLRGRMLLEEEGRLRGALAELRRAVELRPDYVEARMALGIQLLTGANYTEALQQFQAAEQLAPMSVEVHLNLADAYRANKQWQQAKATFERALSMRSDLPQAHFNLGLMYMAAGEEFPGLDRLTALQRAAEEFRTYRNGMGPRLPRDDPSEGYLEDLNRQIEREQRRIQRDQERQQREAERAARGEETG
ncbi:MAG: tetratricopeptide repeat protein [Myxococcota bacterium]